jgi:ankyrin repeat protein
LDRFRWVYCQLDTLCRSFPPSIRKVLNELPITLDETYERTLQGIPREKKDHSRRLFQCLVAAARPLRVEELAEIFTIEFDATPNMVEGWRPESPEEAVLSACSTLVAIVDDMGARIVQFSHFSVKEFLTSDRLRISDIGNISHYYVPLEPAHATLARACLTVLLQLDKTVDKGRLATFPLVFYSAQHWVKHAKFENVTLQIQDFMERLFDPTRSHFAAWTRIYDIDRSMVQPIYDLAVHPAPLTRTPLYYAALYGFSGLAKHLVTVHAEDVNANCGLGSPLHAASYEGHLDIARFLLDLGADPNATNESMRRTPLCAAYDGGHPEVMRLLLERGAVADVWHSGDERLLHHASYSGNLEVTRLLLQYNADVNIRDANSCTPLHLATLWEHQLPQTVKILLEYQAEVNAQTGYGNTPLFLASWCGNLENVKVLLEHGADVHIRGERNWTPFQAATENGHDEVARLLLEHGSEGE